MLLHTIIQYCILRIQFGSVRPEAHSVIHEFLCWTALVEAENALECWRFKFIDARPPPLPAEDHMASFGGAAAGPMRLVSPAEPFSVRIAREQRLKEHQLEIERWRHQVTLTAQVQLMLLFASLNINAFALISSLIFLLIFRSPHVRSTTSCSFLEAG